MTLREYIQSLEALAREHGDGIQVRQYDPDTAHAMDPEEPSICYLDRNGRDFLHVLAHDSQRGEKVVRV